MCSSLSYFLRNDWNFIDNNTSRLFDGMSSQDKIMFNFNITDIMWPDFILTWCLGMRKFLLKDGLKDTEYAIRKQKVFRVVHYVLACLYAYGLWKMDVARYLDELRLAHEKNEREAFALGESSLQRFYKGRTAFLTGATGFLGKHLIEKLLRTCRVSKVFVLIRPKKGKKIESRLQELLEDSVFDVLREQEPNFGEVLSPVAGDMASIRLGINDEDWNTLTKEVEVIFHVAATTRFDETLRLATLINVRGARECLQLGRACKKLCTYVHVSTAYTHCTSKMVGCEIEEAFYRSPMPPEAMISMAEDMEEGRLAAITADLIKDWPNTYTFTKALSEELIRTTSDGLPICVVRPGIVLAAVNEPAPGWIDPSAMYSASGLITLIGFGVKKAVYVDVTKSLGVIPCDYVTNAAIAAGRETAVTQTRGETDTKIYAVTPTCRNRITWDDCGVVFRGQRYVISSPMAYYYGETTDTKSKVLFTILTVLLQVVPAIIADVIRLLMGRERLFLKLAKKEYKMSSALSYFMLNDWTMLDHNTNKLYDSLSEQDKVIFNFDVTDIKWSEYMIIWMIGIRKYLVKDGLKDTDWGVRKQKIFFYVHYCLFLPLYTYLLWKIFYFVAANFYAVAMGIYNQFLL